MDVDKIKVLLTEGQITKRTRELAGEINEQYKGKELVMVGIIKGAIPFFLHLARNIKVNQIWDFLAVSSYGSSKKSSGTVKINMDLATDITDREVLIVEDIVDTGLTMNYLTRILLERKPASLKICSLLVKEGSREKAVNIDFKGFSIPNKFVLGFGLDYEEKLRELPFIGYVEE